MKATDTNLVAEKARVESEIIQTAADHQERMAALRDKRAEIDEAVLAQTRETAMAAEGQRGKHLVELIRGIADEEKTRLAAVERFEARLRAAVDDLNQAFAAAERLHGKAKAIADATNTRLTMLHLGAVDFAQRMGGRMAGVMATVKGHKFRLGAVIWEGGSMYPSSKTDWRSAEERHFADDIANIVETAREG